MSATPVLDVRDLCKSYPGVTALSEVSLAVQAGEVRALLGKNGAGKSTLVKILSGAVSPDRGEVRINGQAASFRNPADARNGGIGTVFQELSLIPHLSVAENIMMGRWADAGGRGGLISPKAIKARARAALEPLDVALDVTQRVARLSVAQQQVVEIAKALSYEPRVLILDEPTSSLPMTEVEVLLSLVRRLADRGMAVIYVSHRMAEIPQVADSVTVFRDGRHVDTRPIAEAGTDQIIQLMTGGEWSTGERRSGSPRRGGSPLLEVDNLTTRRLRSVSFELRRGEILGVAGLLGSGRSSLLRALYGDEKILGGSVSLSGRSIVGKTPEQLSRSGVGFAPEERKRDGLALGLSITDNLTMASLAKHRAGPFLSPAKASAATERMIDRFAIKTPSASTRIGLLSGGNQQKAILGRWVLAGADLLLLDEPTRGVDIHAKDQIYEILREISQQGAGMVVASSELEELFLFCDRILVLNGGEVVADQSIDEADHDSVMAMTMKGTV